MIKKARKNLSSFLMILSVILILLYLHRGFGYILTVYYNMRVSETQEKAEGICLRLF